MKRSNYTFALLVLVGSLVSVQDRFSFSQAVNSPKPLKVPSQMGQKPTGQNNTEYGSVQTARRANPLRSVSEVLQENAVKQAAGTSNQGNPVVLAAQRGNTKPISSPQTPQKTASKSSNAVDEFSVPANTGQFPADLSLTPHDLSVPLPDVNENIDPFPTNINANVDSNDTYPLPTHEGTLEQLDQFSDSVNETTQLDGAAPFSPSDTPVPSLTELSPGKPVAVAAKTTRSIANGSGANISGNTVTPQNADPIAKVDQTATVNPPVVDAIPPASPRTAVIPKIPGQYSRSNVNPRVGSLDRSPIRQTPTTRNMAAQEANNDIVQVPQPPQVFEGTGVPGPSNLEGNQSPQLVLEKQSPREVQINQPATLRTIVKNIGATTAKEIVLRDQVPRGTRLVSTNPKTTETEGSELLWSLGSLAPQEEIAVEMVVVPLSEGEFGSVATLQFASEVSGKTVATQAMLQLEIQANSEVLLGDKITYNLTLTNPGSGTATGVVLELHVPDGLEHSRGQELEFTVGDLKPKESKQYPLTLQTKAAGEIITHLRAKADNELESIAEATVAVLAPELQLQIDGPRQRFLNHKAAYQLTVANSGTAPAQKVNLVAKLPSGMKFESTDQQGVYDEQMHSVHWALEELPAQDAGEIELIATPLKEGEQTIKFEGIGQNQLKAETSYEVSVQGIPSLSFSVVCLSSPVEVGKTAIYEVKVQNRGTKSANNVNIHVRLSEGMQFASAEGPTKHRSNAGVIQYDPIAALEPNQEKTYKFNAKCLEVGDHRISVSMSSDELKTPVTKEESTLVYGDQ